MNIIKHAEYTASLCYLLVKGLVFISVMDKKVIYKKILCSLSYTETILYKTDRKLFIV